MKKLVLRLSLTAALSISIGIATGAAFAKRTIGMSFGRMSEWAAVGTYAQLAELQYRYADEQDARAALSDFLNFVLQLRATGKVADHKALETEVARAYLRLAVLDKDNGNMSGYQANVLNAQHAL